VSGCPLCAKSGHRQAARAVAEAVFGSVELTVHPDAHDVFGELFRVQDSKRIGQTGVVAEIGDEIIGAGRGEKDCRKYRETARAIEPPSDVVVR
jgi:hypothetical protein